MRIIEVLVKPNSRAASLHQGDDGRWHAQLKSPPIDGRANAELIALVAQAFGLRKSQVSIKGGATGRIKRLSLPDIG